MAGGVAAKRPKQEGTRRRHRQNMESITTIENLDVQLGVQDVLLYPWRSNAALSASPDGYCTAQWHLIAHAVIPAIRACT